MRGILKAGVREMNRLKEYRKLRGITAKELAQAVGTSRSNISMIEIGLREANLELAKLIADYFGTSIEAIFFADNCHVKGQKTAPAEAVNQ